MYPRGLIYKFLTWRLRHISNKNFVLILSGIVGCISGIAAVSLKFSVHYIQHLLLGLYDESHVQILYYLSPLIGIGITTVIAVYFFREHLGHGISTVIHAIAQRSSILPKRMMISRQITSAFTVGFGGSVGLEAPIAVTGSSIGANIAQLMHMRYKTRTLLIGCGSAAAISAIFEAPIAGVIFAIEVLLTEVSIKLFIPLLISSVTGYITALMLVGDDLLFHFKLVDRFAATDVPFYFALGIVCGIIGLYFTRVSYFVEGKIHKIKNVWFKVLFAGLSLGAIIFIFPPIFGEGYATIERLLSGHGNEILERSMLFSNIKDPGFILLFFFGILLIKAIATALTIGAGGSGGIFAPSLFIGGLTGFIFSQTVNLLGISQPISTRNFTLVGMCGVMSAVLHAPLTAIFLIAEVTGGYTLFVPLMLVSAIAYSTIAYFEPHSIYTKQLIERGELYTNKDNEVLHLLNVKKLIEKDFKTVHPDATLGELIQIVKVSKRNLFPVVNSECNLVGIIMLDDIRKMMFERQKYGTTLVKTIMKIPKAQVCMHDDINIIVKKFEDSGLWNVPVVNKDGVYIGFFSKSKIFSAYRERVKRQNRED